MIKYELIYIFSMHMHLFPPRRDTHAFPLSHQNDNPDPARGALPPIMKREKKKKSLTTVPGFLLWINTIH